MTTFDVFIKSVVPRIWEMQVVFSEACLVRKGDSDFDHEKVRMRSMKAGFLPMRDQKWNPSTENHQHAVGPCLSFIKLWVETFLKVNVQQNKFVFFY